MAIIFWTLIPNFEKNDLNALYISLNESLDILNNRIISFIFTLITLELSFGNKIIQRIFRLSEKSLYFIWKIVEIATDSNNTVRLYKQYYNGNILYKAKYW